MRSCLSIDTHENVVDAYDSPANEQDPQRSSKNHVEMDLGQDPVDRFAV